MNHHDNDHDDALAQRLRGLPSERVPPAAVWQRIAAQMEQTPRLQPPPVAAVAAVSSAPARRALRRHWPRYAAAAGVVALVGMASMMLLPQQPPATVAVTESALQQHANSITYQYRQAMATLPQDKLPAELQPALRELDESAGSIRSAIAQSPDATFLLGQLQRTYALRLELTRKGVNPTGIST
ncbi:hypothetical protein ABB27_01825 [Stenotrophomonas terrae]|uniref:Uncharacterized protein n=1 Tax=Stenotrophomonas terrae TaxID=405446 RepID=A0A0R0CQN1_9GAMM|nr:hypothetical protein ABB27_01825 [Stenotrophomonas terrae]